jgi:hypothetical protein
MDLTSIPEGWRPTEGDVIIGKVEEVTKGWSDYTSSYYPILVIRPDEGDPISVHAFHAVLKNRLVELRPDVGERIGIKYVGKQKSKDGRRDVTVYIVKIDGRSAGNVWDSVDESPRATSEVASDVPTDDDIPF